MSTSTPQVVDGISNHTTAPWAGDKCQRRFTPSLVGARRDPAVAFPALLASPLPSVNHIFPLVPGELQDRRDRWPWHAREAAERSTPGVDAMMPLACHGARAARRFFA
jgi:hypothetical protein